MCGIVGYTGKNQATPILIDGLERLEYRGYDSSGIAVSNDSGIEIIKSKGRLFELKKLTNGTKPEGVTGIGHTGNARRTERRKLAPPLQPRQKVCRGA